MRKEKKKTEIWSWTWSSLCSFSTQMFMPTLWMPPRKQTVWKCAWSSSTFKWYQIFLLSKTACYAIHCCLQLWPFWWGINVFALQRQTTHHTNQFFSSRTWPWGCPFAGIWSWVWITAVCLPECTSIKGNLEFTASVTVSYQNKLQFDLLVTYNYNWREQESLYLNLLQFIQ